MQVGDLVKINYPTLGFYQSCRRTDLFLLTKEFTNGTGETDGYSYQYIGGINLRNNQFYHLSRKDLEVICE